MAPRAISSGRVARRRSGEENADQTIAVGVGRYRAIAAERHQLLGCGKESKTESIRQFGSLNVSQFEI
jgi:hypothetical protein